ncbi:phage tail tape measure protein [Shewanella sp. D64]|uniref:phage tail tape measure protein n=1 Tax=unclassified Shewanella TaxID=196818 RepID=UPI0022BA163C|nr:MULTISPECIES: phage tail tape measure protein [unclassified Shewanella]MEC4728851.1 phage tail tape measure protein [Shewanella sp. D64]MEC4740725.1 phage tail tape measure protein [Shewanella sp. E94]WBJ95316.1 phage tail tape measure protein [Shewanella sp. MTB7]
MSSNSLNFSVWLRDRTQSGFNAVTNRMRSMQRMGRETSNAMKGIGAGGLGVWAAGQTVSALVGPAREMNAARGELNSLLDGDGTKTLDAVQSEAMRFASTYGKSATEFVRASYDIQSAISGLSGSTLAKFTNASAVLATATKADTATITNYMGTMYGIFQSSADKMGKSKWVEQIAGQTAVAVKMFKTTGSAMNEAFASVGARASNQNISSAEQFAVLGMMQSSMDGSVAGTAYAGFMDAMPNAQKNLGLSFSGDDGKALGMVAIINKLKGKLGNELTVDVVGQLNTAFGTVASGLIQGLWTKTDDLSKNIASLGDITNMDQAVAMAAKISDPWDKLGQSASNVRIIFGQAFDRALMPMITYMTSAITTLQEWMIAFPNITFAVATFTKWMLVLTAVIAMGAILKGAVFFAKFGWAVLKWGVGPLLKIIPLMLRFGLTALVAIGWIPLAFIAVGAAIGLAIYYWDDLVASFSNTTWGQAIIEAFGTLSGTLSMVWEIVKQWLSGWGELISSLSNTAWADAITGALSSVIDYLGSAWEMMKGLWTTASDFLSIGSGTASSTDNVGAGMKPEHMQSLPTLATAQPNYSTPPLIGSTLSASIEEQIQLVNNGIPISKDIERSNEHSIVPTWLTQNSQNNKTNSMSIGAVNVSTQRAPTPSEMQNYFSLVTP